MWSYFRNREAFWNTRLNWSTGYEQKKCGESATRARDIFLEKEEKHVGCAAVELHWPSVPVSFVRVCSATVRDAAPDARRRVKSHDTLAFICLASSCFIFLWPQLNDPPLRDASVKAAVVIDGDEPPHSRYAGLDLMVVFIFFSFFFRNLDCWFWFSTDGHG